MTLKEIARALGVQTAAEIAAELGVAESAICPASLPEPCLILDYRGGEEGARRWDRYAKPPLPKMRGKLNLDPVTGLKKMGKKGKR